MVGTAFWWTKEEAERDAAAAGLPMIPVGPMVDTAEVERQKSRADTNVLNHRHAKNAIGDIKAFVERLVSGSAGQQSVATGYLSDIVDFIERRTIGDPVHIGDANILRLELQESRRNEFNTCAQLAERDAMLRELLADDIPLRVAAKIEAALSASAEPSKLPDPLGCNHCAHADCGKFDGLRQVECRAMADNACARPGASS
ncbi:hypothetical protein PPUJ20028_33470 [Pseudomonas putida]|uniref:Uncharacterized protein n=1 Tax=Pseudomonas putida TaxID=303 RepID=A0AA37RE43_PSEPU|nr:hypothetical protein [Pseudomonas putida]GLO14764.1 hypothetical protein PPUJ20028_33470 [Pseudomonas putida]GLO34869.1 hypothetical protein PPUN14671_17020 [Pseudomonas putida]HDS0963646.1 hypothetical protein [Pseudomonas putida]HDS0988906.1 hypothetical protein [Pseudomonas putida]